jgi:hypothetical protein
VRGSNAKNLSVYLSLSQLAKMLCLPYYVYVLSSIKLELRAEQVLPGSKWGWAGEGGGRQGGEMTQTMYAHMNKEGKKSKIEAKNGEKKGFGFALYCLKKKYLLYFCDYQLFFSYFGSRILFISLFACLFLCIFS